MEYLFSVRLCAHCWWKEENEHHAKIWITFSIRSQSEKAAVYCEIPSTWPFWKMKNDGDSQKIQRLRRREGWIGGAQRMLRAMRRFYMILQWWIHVFIYLFKPIECTTPGMHPNGSYGLWVITMIHVASLIVTNAVLWHWMLTMGKAVCELGQGTYGNSILSAQFFSEHKSVF